MAALKLPKTAARAKREKARGNETNAIVWPLIRALNDLPGVQAWRNNTGTLRDENGRPVQFGLCVGSSDVIGVVRIAGFGCFFAIECKRPGETPTPDQLAFLELVRRMGGAANWVTDWESGVRWVGRLR
jgi:hypothetical protein